jgi:hypothetical protein
VGLKFNPFTSNFDFDTVGSTTWLPPVADEASLPITDVDGAARVVLDQDEVYVFDLATTQWHRSRLDSGAFQAAATASGLSLTQVDVGNISRHEVRLHPADSINPGGVSTAAQNFAGNKTFDNNVIVTGDLTVNGTTTTINTTVTDVTDANITVNNTGTQATADANDAGITVEMSDATNVQIGYDSTLASRFKIGDIGAGAEIADVSSIQTLTNKTINDITNDVHADVTHVAVRNVSGVQLDKGTPVYISGYNLGQDKSEVELSDANVAITMPAIGLMESDLLNNTNGEVVASGVLKDFDTSLWGVGDVLYVSTTAGILTNIRPTGSGELVQAVAKVLRSNNINGRLLIQGAGRVNATPNDITLVDANTTFQDDGDLTKQMKVELSGLTTATTRTLTIPDADTTIVGTAVSQTLTNKTIDADLNTITNIDNADIKVAAAIDAAKVADGSVSNAEFQTLDGVTSAIQTQLNGKVNGPASATDEAIARYDTTTGKLVQNSLVTINDVGVLSGATQANVDNLRLDGNTISSISGDVVLAPTTDIDVSTSIIKNVVDPTANQHAATKKYVDDNTTFVTGDLDQVSFSIVNNQITLANVTGVAFANGTVRSAEIQYSIAIDATADLFESGKLMIIQRGADWVVTQTGNGDNSQLLFDVNASGQLQYTSGNIAGFVSGALKCRALVTSV